MPRQPKPNDYLELRRLYDAAGNREELNRWIDAALKKGKQRPGRKKKKYRIPLDALLHVLEPPQGASRTEAIRQLARNYRLGDGAEQSTVERLRRDFKKYERKSEKLLRDHLDALRDLIRARIKSGRA